MKSKFSYALACSLLMTLATDAYALSGRWRGDLDMGAAKLTLVFSLKETPEGKTTATMDCVQQGAKDIPLEVLTCTADSIRVQCRMIGATYAGAISGDRIEGTFSQSGYNLPLTLTPEEDMQTRRPQTPRPPFSYMVRDTTFRSNDGVVLAGTLTLPADVPANGVPVVVMATGSGPQNRDEELFDHHPFAVIADHLARNGIASFRYDDRGVGASGGNYAESTIETFQGDLESALNFVRTLPGFSRYGLLGHSEGGTLALLAGATQHPDFIISLAGVSIPLREVMIAQNAHQMDLTGVTGKVREDSLELIRLLFEEIRRQHLAGESSPLDPDALCREHNLEVPAMTLQAIRRSIQQRNGYFDSLISLDPTESLRRITCPLLAVNGTRDTQVDAVANLSAFSRELPTAQIALMEGLNHLMQSAETGETAEYDLIRETISPAVLTRITDFILNGSTR